MTLSTKTTTWGLLATLALTASAPVLADPASQQKNKNQWRNLAVVGAAVAGYGLLNHNSTATILGAAGTAYSANRYEQDRHNQSQDSANRSYYYRNNGRDYGRTYGWNPPASYNNSGGNGSYDNQQYYGSYNAQQSNVRQNNGKHKGWYKHQGDKDHDGDRD